MGRSRRTAADHHEGTVIRLSVEKLPSGGVNEPVWLWWSGTGADPQDASTAVGRRSFAGSTWSAPFDSQADSRVLILGRHRESSAISRR
jgi:hypothetical protein